MPVCWNSGAEIIGYPWGADFTFLGRYELDPDIKSVALVHHLVYSTHPIYPGAEAVGNTAATMLRKMKGFDLVVTGDNHQTFVYATGNGQKLWVDPEEDPKTAFAMKERFPDKPGYRLLVNPGSIMRTTARQANHEPCVFLWSADDNTVERVVLPHEKGVVSREHIEAAEERDDRIEAFISRMSDDVEIGLDFRHNLRTYMELNDVSKEVQSIVWSTVE